MSLRSLSGPAIATAVFITLAARRADACGGCFNPPPPPDDPSQISLVSGHRMAAAVGKDRFVLWDQIRYTGRPKDFAWVLPVRPGSKLELSNESFFRTLDAWTSMRIAEPQITCTDAQGCHVGAVMACAGGGDTAEDSSAAGPRDDPFSQVTVVEEKVVGPYESVTLSSTDGMALRNWLASHGYVIPDDIGPLIDDYVALGTDFIALRLLPNQGVQAMEPVRVVMPGSDPLLPLRMVKAGSNANVPITLWVFAASRQIIDNYPEVALDWSKLTWNFETDTHNFPDLLKAALAQNGGRSQVTTFSDKALTQPLRDAAGQALFVRADGSAVRYQDGQSAGNLPSLYFRVLGQGCTGPTGFTGGIVAPGHPDYARLTCGKADDLAVAVVGHTVSDLVLTRLDLDLPREALDADCRPMESPQQTVMPNFGVGAVPLKHPCAEAPHASSIAKRAPRSLPVWAAAALVLVALVARRRGRRS